MPRVNFTSNLRRHVAIFVGGNPVADRGEISLPPVYAVRFG